VERIYESQKEMGGDQEQMGCLGIIRCAYVEMDKPLLAKIMIISFHNFWAFQNEGK
jgi:hypothetical protein